MAATIWIDVEDLFDYARDHARPTGIQRQRHHGRRPAGAVKDGLELVEPIASDEMVAHIVA